MLTIYNTKTKNKEVFIPIKDKKVNMYVCGPTVYDDVHIGNARPVIFFEFFKNYLLYLDYDVTYVSNITDIDDKIIEKAIKQSKTEKEISLFYTNAFIDVTKKLNNDNLPDKLPLATNYLDEMITFIEDLIKNEYAYVKEDAVYFRVDKIKNYGEFSNKKIEELTDNVRITNTLEKENAKDFTLWKKTDKGITFKSPWFDGRPGWHTECAVMNREIFGEMIDIHGGGSDLIFPHHENEIAQTLASDGHDLAKYWLHVGRLDLNEEKMSKSLGNVILVKDLLSQVSANTFKLLILGHHYRLPISYSDDLLMQYIKMYDKIKKTVLKHALLIKLNNKAHLNDLNIDALNSFESFMNDDLNTPNVVTLIQDLLKQINGFKDDFDKLTKDFNTLKVILEIFGIFPIYNVSDEVINTYILWEEARNKKEFDKADIYRQKLLDEGWI